MLKMHKVTDTHASQIIMAHSVYIQCCVSAILCLRLYHPSICQDDYLNTMKLRDPILLPFGKFLPYVLHSNNMFIMQTDFFFIQLLNLTGNPVL